MTEPYAPYGPPPYFDRHDFRHRYRRAEPHFFGFFVRLAIGVLVILILLAVLRSVANGSAGGPWLEVAGGFGIALAVLGGIAVFALFLAVIFGLVLPALSSRGGDWMNPERWATFEATKDLKVRYARGEISREEYMAVLRDLEPGAFAREAPPAGPEPAEGPAK